MDAIDTTPILRVPVTPTLTRSSCNWRLAVAVIAFTILLLLAPRVAYAGNASAGELAFHPCTRCHPVAVDSQGRPVSKLPIGMKKHTIELEVHEILGDGEAACLACHKSPQEDPGLLLLADGSTVEITGDVSRVCQRCHFEKYREFTAGVHGKRAEKCTAAGCHDPHTPSWIYVAGLPPFQGTGMEVKAVGADREGFKPLAPPPVDPPVETPLWLSLMTGAGLVTSLGTAAYLIKGRASR